MNDDLEAQRMAVMRANDFERAWLINDEVRRRGTGGFDREKHQGPRHCQRIWRGEPLQDARVLVRCYHGLGDTLQFIRFAAPLRRIARQVMVWCQPELCGLVADVTGVDRVLPLHDGTVDASFDVDVEIMELPYALRATAAATGDPVPYLRSGCDIRQADSFRHVGLVWECGGWDLKRSIPWTALAPITALPAIRFYSLQPTACCGSLPILRRPETSIASLASFMTSLDLVITVDTMAAHLAGGLGLRVWTLLRSGCDWRWGDVGSTTPWYPTMRLLRQTVADDWTCLMADLAEDLGKLWPSVRAQTQERV